MIENLAKMREMTLVIRGKSEAVRIISSTYKRR